MRFLPGTAVLVLCSCNGHVVLEDFERWHHNLDPSPPTRADDARVQGVCTAGTLNWIIPVGGNDVVVVDAGFEQDGETLRKAIGTRDLRAVLLTHAHADHTAAARALGVPVYVGLADLPLLERRYRYRAIVPAFLIFAATAPPEPELIHVARGRSQVIPIGTKRFTAIALPGHTPGSTAWLVDDLVFTGDAVQSPMGDEVWPAPESVTEDIDEAYRSLRWLLAFPFQTMFDAHYGRLDDARAAIERAVMRERSDQPSPRPAGCGQPWDAEK